VHGENDEDPDEHWTVRGATSEGHGLFTFHIDKEMFQSRFWPTSREEYDVGRLEEFWYCVLGTHPDTANRQLTDEKIAGCVRTGLLG
jgi:hypothetical protein